ncbi:MAG: SH3 domain-containing protein, partial [Candidatus Limivicinus sp.]
NKSEYMKVTIRPNSSRQVTIDEEQYLMLSEDAENLVFFYLSPVPDEPESDTTGQVSQMQSVVYAYVKGTEVRFRKAPSLEGQVIDSLNDGQQVQVLAITGEWTHVQVGDQKGYIFSQYLTSDDPAAVKKPETEQPAASEAPTASPSPSPNAAQAGTAATPTPSPAAAASSGTTAASSGGNAAARPSTTTASGDRPSNAIENSPLANGAGTTSQQTDSSGGDDDVTVSATGPTADAGAAQASLATVTPPPSSGGGGEAISSRSGDPSEIAVPANEYPTQNEPTPVE